MKPYFVNNVDLTIADIATLSFSFAVSAGAEKEYAANVSMHFAMLQILRDTIDKALSDHKALASNPNTNKSLS